jgi:hypothetical protein
MDKIDDIKRLRDEYESSLDEAEAKRAEFHRAIKKLNLSGVPLRTIAEALGLSHQRVHQIVTGEAPPKKRGHGRKALGAGAALLLLSASIGMGYMLWPGSPNHALSSLASSPNFTSSPPVIQHTAVAPCSPGNVAIPAGLPAPIVANTRCGEFTLRPSGPILVAPHVSIWNPPGLAMYGETWGVGKADGHLEVYGGSPWLSGARPHWQVVWRSKNGYQVDPYDLSSVAVGPAAVAFSVGDGRLYVAPTGLGGQQFVTKREWAGRLDEPRRPDHPPPHNLPIATSRWEPGSHLPSRHEELVLR